MQITSDHPATPTHLHRRQHCIYVRRCDCFRCFDYSLTCGPTSDFHNASDGWLARLFEIWKPSLDLERIPENRDSFLKGGYYVARPRPGLLVTILHTHTHTLTHTHPPPRPSQLPFSSHWCASSGVGSNLLGRSVSLSSFGSV